MLRQPLPTHVLTCGLLLLLPRPGASEPGPSFPKLTEGVTLSYRQKLTGMLPSPGRELRWSLSLRKKTVKLSATARTCPSPRLGKGAPADPPCTGPFAAGSVAYEGRIEARPYGIDIWVSSEKPAEGFPAELSLHCLRAVIGVLPVGATLQSGDACKGDGPPPRWQPATTQDVGVWHCAVRDEQSAPWNGYQVVGPLVFAAGAGLEWIYVNNDCAGQEGAFRLPGADK
jgi:hypothetical protein